MIKVIVNYIMIPIDIIYTVSQYNCNIKDSVNLSLINEEIYNNCANIFLNNPIINQDNYKIILKYKFNNYELDNNFVLKNPNELYQKVKKYFISSLDNLNTIPIYTENLVIDLTDDINEIGDTKIILPNNLKYLKYLTFGDRFNLPITLPNNLTHLTFGNCFNQPLALPNSLTHLTFGYSFNQSINLPNSLTHLTFGFSFNQPINLPDDLTHLTFGYQFNQPIDLPNNLKYLTFESNFNQPIILPNSLIHLTFGYQFDQPIDLPNNLKYLTFGDKFNQPITLSNSLIHLTLGYNFYQSISLPNSLTHLTANNANFSINMLSNNITHLYLTNYQHRLNLSKSGLTHLTLGWNFNQPIILPDGLTHLTFDKYSHFNQPIILPNSLIEINFGLHFNQKVNLIDKNTGKTFKNLESISFSDNYRRELQIGSVENKCKKVKISLNYKYFYNIFPIEKQYDFDNYILYDSRRLIEHKKINVIY